VHGEVQLRVVGVLVVPHAVPLDDISDRAAVYGEQQRSQN